MVAGHHHQLAVGAERLAQVGEHRHRQLGDVALGAVAQLDAVAEDHQPVDAAHRLEQRLAQLRPAEQVGALGGADVEVGDDERAHGRNTLGCLAMPPLDGLLVADFSRVLAGPYATMLLGDLGADVVKVERPGTGDDTRAWGPPWAGSDSTYYLVTNRNKRSVALDLTDEGDRELARRLGERADVLVESFRPGLMAEWGLDGDTLRERNPGLVSCSVTAFGTGEAGRALPGYDFLLQAMGGLMHVTGDPDGPPTKVGAAVVDLIAGLLAANGIQGALLERERTGRGRHVEVSLMDSALTALLNQGIVVGGGRRRALAPRQPAPEHRPLPAVRDRRPARRRRGRQRPAVRAAVRGARPRRAGRERALRHQRRPRRAPRGPRAAALGGVRAPRRRPLGRGRCAPPPSRSARSTASTRRSRSPTSWAWSRPRSTAASG